MFFCLFTFADDEPSDFYLSELLSLLTSVKSAKIITAEKPGETGDGDATGLFFVAFSL